MNAQPETDRAEAEIPNWLRLVQRQVESLRYGLVEIVVHDQRVVQIERTERLRLDREESTSVTDTLTPAHQNTGGTPHHPAFTDRSSGRDRPGKLHGI
jgi:hypothetical protein